tara:strand:+ start:3491 stop:4261 length:771 start_codon:yes stop_codon:yes gene_type:complete
MSTLSKEICSWIENYAIDNNLSTLVIGVSGGVDSAVVSTLCAMTGMPTKILNMPISSKAKNTSLSDLHCNWIVDNYSNVTFEKIDLTDVFLSFEQALLDNNDSCDLSIANSKSRLRMMALYYVAGASNGIVVGTGNKVEDFGVGFYTKYGDGGVDISPIADLTKTQVRKLAKLLGVNSQIIEAPPTDGLWGDSRTDEEQIGATYEELELAMCFGDNTDFSELTFRQQEVIGIYQSFHIRNKHKMLPIPVFELKEEF